MTDAFQPNLDFAAVDQADERDAFVVDLEGYEGPLHVLLALARTQKVDLLKLSITRLAEQYLAFVHEARRRNFALAADYLVMASWLAYLKSRLLLPRNEKGKDDEIPAEEMAAALAFRLQKLEAMRRAVEAARDWLRDILPRLEQWTPLDKIAPEKDEEEGPTQASYTASTLSASLELVKEGAMDVKQAEAFADIFLKRRAEGFPLELTP
jgi:chromatin segregation and condensation protein Rec8/ScpA/Scc1 (kleisin family)